MTGTPMVAGSPIRHDTSVPGNPVEVQTYQPPWKALSDFALQSDLDQPSFQHLVRGGTTPNATPHMQAAPPRHRKPVKEGFFFTN